MTVTVDPIPRMKSEDRRELILAAATRVFGDYGYVGATTDQIARAAEVSQPYVVRMFGTKERLFLEVLQRALGRIFDVFRAEVARGTGEDLGHRLGNAYADLLKDRGILLSLMNAFIMGSDPVIGPVARAGFLEVWEFLRTDAGFDAERAQAFLAHGMLINTLVGLRMSDEYADNPIAKECLTLALSDKLELVLDATEPAPAK